MIYSKEKKNKKTIQWRNYILTNGVATIGIHTHPGTCILTVMVVAHMGMCDNISQNHTHTHSKCMKNPIKSKSSL